MTRPPGWRRLFRLSLGRDSVERDVDEELAFHLAMREDKLRGAGLAPDAAHRLAQLRFGDAERVRDECLNIDRQHAREVRLVEWFESLWFDIRYALRIFRRMPAFTLVATVTMALGIGATTAMFTLVNGILLRPLPYPDSDRLARVIQSYPEVGLDTWGINQVNIAMYRDRATDFESFTAYRNGSVTTRGPDGPQRMPVLLVTAPFFHVLGVGPMLGRSFTEEEDAPGKNTVVILSYGTWQRRFGGDRSVVGASMDIDGQAYRVVGVMPRNFAFPRPDVGAWIPMGLNPSWTFGFTNSGLGRLRPGVTPEHAERQTTGIMWDWARSTGRNATRGATDPSKTRMKTIVRPLHDVFTARSAQPLTVLFAAVGLILLIATANVATLLSGRAAARQREINVRAALGASSGRMVRQLLTESIALSLVGGVVGVALAFVAVRLFTHSKLAALPRIDEVAVDGRVLAFTLVIAIGSGLLFGLLPALHAGRRRLTSALTGQRASSRGAARRLDSALVVAQLSLSVVLLVAAGLVLKSFQRLTHVDLGFRPERVTSLTLPLPQRIGNSAVAIKSFVDGSLDRVRALPGVESAALTSALPMQGGGNYDGYLIEGRPVPPNGAEDQAYQIAASPGYFRTIGVPLLYGRDFAATDDSVSQNVAIVDAALANRYWKGADAIGKQIRSTGNPPWYTIIGVVGTVRDDDATLLPRPHVYYSIPQVGASRLSLAMRISRSTAAVVAGARRAVAELDSSIPLDDVQSYSGIIDQTFAARRLTKILLGGFALIGLILAAVGIYGVMSLHVANRGREFGIRLAIGAEPGALVRLVLREGAVLALLGVVLGIGGALAITRWLSSLLYDVSPTDPVVLVVLPLGLAAVAVATCYAPARRAARSDPLAVLRTD